MSENSENEEPKGALPTVIRWGARGTGAGVASALGFLAAGPAGAGALGVAGYFVGEALEQLAEQLITDVFPRKEKARIGQAVAGAVSVAAEHAKAGHQPRQDGFFGGEGSASEEVFDGVVDAARSAHETRKAWHLGAFFGHAAYDERLDGADVLFLLERARSLTYRQFCLLAIFADTSSWGLSPDTFRSVGVPENVRLVTVRREVLELERRGMVYRSDDTALLDVTDVLPAVMALDDLGEALHAYASLHTIPSADLEQVASLLRATPAKTGAPATRRMPELLGVTHAKSAGLIRKLLAEYHDKERDGFYRRTLGLLKDLDGDEVDSVRFLLDEASGAVSTLGGGVKILRFIARRDRVLQVEVWPIDDAVLEPGMAGFARSEMTSPMSLVEIVAKLRRHGVLYDNTGDHLNRTGPGLAVVFEEQYAELERLRDLFTP